MEPTVEPTIGPSGTAQAQVVFVGCGEDVLAPPGLRAGCFDGLEPDLLAALSAAPEAVVLGPTVPADVSLSEWVRLVRERAPQAAVIVWQPGEGVRSLREALAATADDVVVEDEPRALAKSLHGLLERRRLLPQGLRRASPRGSAPRFHGMLSRDPALWRVFEVVSRVAPTEATCLVLGETGTGKELLARAIHARSGRRGPFVAVNCAGIPEHLIESELFGHEKGSFTGAERAARGLFSHADGGTLLLDEIGDMPAQAQLSLLRVLQEGTVRPVGGSEEVPVSVRVVAATSRPLDESVRAGAFREDLLYRLDVIRLVIPPLRDRPDDLLLLFEHFLARFARQHGVLLPDASDDFFAALLAHPWPGNVRELMNFTERLVLTSSPERPLDGGDVRQRVAEPRRRNGAVAVDAPPPPPPEVPLLPPVDLSLDLRDWLEPAVERLEKVYLAAALQRTRGGVQAAADLAGISRRTLLRKMKRFALRPRDYR